MGKALVIAEKPSAGADMARVLGCTIKRNGYIEGEDYIVTWAIGHLIGQKMPEEHNPAYKEWNLSDLPFRFEINESLKVLTATSGQFKVIKELIHRADVDMLINAGDAGREGYLIQAWIYRMAGNKKPVKVLWASSLTEEALKKAFSNLKSPLEFQGLLLEAEARAQLDYILGINYSRALSVKNELIIDGKRAVIHYGRCQTPLLKLIVDRDKEIEDFAPVPYFEVELKYRKGFTGVLTTSEHKVKKFKNRTEADVLMEKLATSPEAVVTVYKSEDKSVAAPPLYNLTNLQKEMGKKYGYTADETLLIAQSLYEKYKVLSYPRTDSQYLSMDLYNEIEQHLENLNFDHFAPLLLRMKSERKADKRYFNDVKVTDHHALIPTINSEMKYAYGQMTENEKNVFNAVAKSFIAIFYPDYRYRAVEIIAVLNDEKFLSRGHTILSLGYREVLKEEKAEEKEELQILPVLEQGDILQIDDVCLLCKETQTPPAYTIAGILTLMEKYSIGTSATRAELINKLQGKSGKETILPQKAFIAFDKGKYVATELGKKVIDVVPERLKEPELTLHLEAELVRINEGSLSIEEFLEELVKEQKEVISHLEEKKEEITGITETSVFCPKCGRPLKVNDKAFSCSGWKEGCDFTLWTKIAGKKLTNAQTDSLLCKGKTGRISGFKKKDGTTFAAHLAFSPDYKVIFKR